jgi:hypothetical protein
MKLPSINSDVFSELFVLPFISAHMNYMEHELFVLPSISAHMNSLEYELLMLLSISVLVNYLISYPSGVA